MERCPVCSSPRWELFCTAFDRLRNRPEKLWKILRCRCCGFGWTAPPLPEDDIACHYPDDYLGDPLHTLQEFLSGRLQQSRSWRREQEKVRLLERFISGGTILDVGCGDGKFLWALDRTRWRCTGVEQSRHTVELVGSRLPHLRLIEGDLFSDALSPATFDVITFWHVFEHLPRPRQVLGRTAELLRPGGWLLISLPNLESLQARLFRRHWYAFDDVPRHLYHFSPKSLELLLQETGFRISEHAFFSRMANIHALKYSLINWSETHFNNRIPYYLLKPLLLAFPLLERCSGKFGMLTTIGQKPGRANLPLLRQGGTPKRSGI